MRRMLGVLREPGGSPAELAPQPGLSAIPELIDGFREAGMPVRLTTSGVPEADPAVGLAVYRLVQEGLTNALRHGRNAQHVEVRLQHRPGEVEVLVEDDAPPPQGDAPATHGAGRGLAGLRERIALYGGTLDAGPRGARGWRLRATLPVAPSEPCGTEHPHERTEDGTPE
jgi:signal transduction histidine kinase